MTSVEVLAGISITDRNMTTSANIVLTPRSHFVGGIVSPLGSTRRHAGDVTAVQEKPRPVM